MDYKNRQETRSEAGEGQERQEFPGFDKPLSEEGAGSPCPFPMGSITIIKWSRQPLRL